MRQSGLWEVASSHTGSQFESGDVHRARGVNDAVDGVDAGGGGRSGGVGANGGRGGLKPCEERYRGPQRELLGLLATVGNSVVAGTVNNVGGTRAA